jgi:hypothetical protein
MLNYAGRIPVFSGIITSPVWGADLFDLIDLSLYLEEKPGRHGDLATPRALRPEMRKGMYRDVVYAWEIISSCCTISCRLQKTSAILPRVCPATIPLEDNKTRSAVLSTFAVMGEATKRLPDPVPYTISRYPVAE